MSTVEPFRLTSRASCAGCAAKMGARALAEVLKPLRSIFPPAGFPNLLSGLEMPDDAAVWKLDDERALVLTADFFPPVVDDPYVFGAVAAANALSDLFAMGADPLLALNLVAFPDDLDRGILTEILRGGAEKVLEAGAVIAGGHTIVDAEPKYGLAAAGIVHPDRVLGKGGAREGDVLLLTKPIGTGVLTTAHKRGKLAGDELTSLTASMTRLSRAASRLLRNHGWAVHALTDITGFSLAGHAHEMAHLSNNGLRLDVAEIPRLPGAERCAAEGMIPGGLRRNEESFARFVVERRKLEGVERLMIFDPQTSGGLLAAVAEEEVPRVLESFRAAGEPVWRIGRAVGGEAGTIEVA